MNEQESDAGYRGLADLYDELRFVLHLRPGGQLLFSTYHPRNSANQRSDWMPLRTLVHPEHGVVRVSVASEIDTGARIATDHHRFDVMDGSDRVTHTAIHSIRLRWYSQHEMRNLLESVGFCDIRVCGHHTDLEAAPDETVLVFSARRPVA
jgi:hypothetical protein